MTEPFEKQPAETGLRRLVGKRRACLREIEDLLARAESVRDVTPDEVAAVATKHGVDFRAQLGTARRDLYRRLLERCLADQELSAEETADLAHLRGLLALSDADAGEVHDQVARAVYGRAIDQVLADHRLDPEEEEFLRRLGGTLAIDEPEQARLYDEGTQRARQRFLERTIVRDNVLLAPRHREIEVSGSSARSVEDAIRSALEEAATAVPDLRHFEVTKIRGELASGSVTRWEVALRAGFDAPE